MTLLLRPTLSEFTAMAHKGNLIPVTAQLPADLDTPVSAYLKVAQGDYGYLLESVQGSERIARYSFLGTEPSAVWECRGTDVLHHQWLGGRRTTERRRIERDPLQDIQQLLGRYRYVSLPGLPRFSGGLVGYIGYDVVRFFERLPNRPYGSLSVPDAKLLLSDTVVIFDHVQHSMTIVVNAFLGEEIVRRQQVEAAYRDAARRIHRIAERLRRPLSPGRTASWRPTTRCDVHANMTRPRFESAVRSAQRYIRAGDIIQAVISQRWETSLTSDPFAVYRALRSLNPSPYMYYLKLGGETLVGASPEVFLRCEDGSAEVRPIAGTRRRGATPEEDGRLETELRTDPKERAEHLMLVDLGRNDLGRVCEYGSVTVPEFMVVERYSHVMHLVSSCTGRLRRNASSFDAVRAAFPAGTVTGAPKIRAMEIIDELEPSQRGPYAGLIGYFSFSGNFDSCITIRTMLVKNGVGYIQAGAGIVADSKPSREYQETCNKAAALFQAIAVAGGAARP